MIIINIRSRLYRCEKIHAFHEFYNIHHLTLYGIEIRNRTANLRRPVGRTIISNTVLSYQRGRHYSKLLVGNSPGRPSPLFSTIWYLEYKHFTVFVTTTFYRNCKKIIIHIWKSISPIASASFMWILIWIIMMSAYEGVFAGIRVILAGGKM